MLLVVMLISAAEQLLEDGQILTLLLSGQISFFFFVSLFQSGKIFYIRFIEKQIDGGFNRTKFACQRENTHTCGGVTHTQALPASTLTVLSVPWSFFSSLTLSSQKHTHTHVGEREREGEKHMIHLTYLLSPDTEPYSPLTYLGFTPDTALILLLCPPRLCA